MANRHCTAPEPIKIAPPQMKTTRRDNKDVKAVRSVSNPSLVSQLEDEEEQIETSVSQQFNEQYMQTVYKKYQQYLAATKEFMPPDVVKAVMNVFDTICMDENIMYLSMKISESIVRHDDSWSGFFAGCAERNPLKYSESRGFLMDSRIIMHAMMAFRTLRVLASYLEENNVTQMKNLLDLVALSHICMKVQPDNFKIFVVMMIKSLLHYNIVSDESLPIFVNFSMQILLIIEERIRFWEQKHTSLLNSMFDGSTAPSREYYRELKKWRTYVLSCAKYLAKPLMSLEKQIHSAHKLVTTQLDDETTEKWKIIRCLKKGYKYRSITSTKNNP